MAAHEGKPVGIYDWIEGEILCQKGVTVQAASALGIALAQVHRCTEWLPKIPEGRFGLPELHDRLNAIDGKTDAFRGDTALIRERIEFHAARTGECPQGLVHGDLFRDNVLWVPGVYDSQSEPQVAALIDFESASVGSFAYDIMVCMHAWCFGTEYDLNLVRALLRGYQSVRPLTESELVAMPHEGALAALRFAATRITDFSMRVEPGQTPGRDYKRFLLRLAALEAGALDLVLKDEKL